VIEKVRRALREHSVSKETLIEAINREFSPTVREMRQRLNELIDLVNGLVPDIEVDPSKIAPGAVGQYLRTVTGPVAEWANLGTVPLENLDPSGGSNGDVVTLVAGVPAWAAAGGGSGTFTLYSKSNWTWNFGVGTQYSTQSIATTVLDPLPADGLIWIFPHDNTYALNGNSGLLGTCFRYDAQTVGVYHNSQLGSGVFNAGATIMVYDPP
jgi:hypothetical protein